MSSFLCNELRSQKKLVGLVLKVRKCLPEARYGEDRTI
jgi:hypothetical protein